MDKARMEMPVESAVNCPMNYPIPHGGFVNNPRFRVGDGKLMIRRVVVGIGF